MRLHGEPLLIREQGPLPARSLSWLASIKPHSLDLARQEMGFVQLRGLEAEFLFGCSLHRTEAATNFGFRSTCFLMISGAWSCRQSLSSSSWTIIMSKLLEANCLGPSIGPHRAQKQIVLLASTDRYFCAAKHQTFSRYFGSRCSIRAS